MKYKLYYEEHPFEDEYYGTYETISDMLLRIHKWIEDTKFHSYYIRSFGTGKRTYIDFGSHTRFFYYVEVK